MSDLQRYHLNLYLINLVFKEINMDISLISEQTKHLGYCSESDLRKVF